MKYKLTLAHADTCFSDYWGGHHLPHIAAMVWHGMSFAELKQSLKGEINQGAIAGSFDWEILTEEWYSAALNAVDNLELTEKANPHRLFLDLEPYTDHEGYDYDVYAYFVFLSE